MPDPAAEPAPEDAKLVTLARATLARTGATEAAAIRDLDGRTYAGAAVALPSLSVSALQVCVAMAVSSAARGLEAAVVLLREPDGAEQGVGVDPAVVADLGGDGVPVHVGDARGRLLSTLTTGATPGTGPGTPTGDRTATR